MTQFSLCLNFNPPTPWGVGQPRRIKMANTFTISIHPLRGEWDGVKNNTAVGYLAISIHPLRGEWDARYPVENVSYFSFQSTHSVGSGTDTIGRRLHANDFNPPTPWGVGLRNGGMGAYRRRFQSTHSVGSGTILYSLTVPPRVFQSTHSVGSGT